MLDLDELLRLRDAATPGPWEMVDARAFLDDEDFEIRNGQHCIGYGTSEADAQYIVASCNVVPELVTRIKHLEAQLYEAVGYIISNESQSMIDCRICFFEQYCERGKGQCNPDHDMCRKAIMHCITTEER